MHVFIAWWVTALFIPYAVSTGLSCPECLSGSSGLPSASPPCLPQSPNPRCPALSITPASSGWGALQNTHPHGGGASLASPASALGTTDFSLRLIQWLPRGHSVIRDHAANSRLWNASFVVRKKLDWPEIPRLELQISRWEVTASV